MTWVITKKFAWVFFDSHSVFCSVAMPSCLAAAIHRQEWYWSVANAYSLMQAELVSDTDCVL